MRPSLLYVIAVEGMGTGLRGHQVPTSVFPPRCAITHRQEIHGEKNLQSSLSRGPVRKRERVTCTFCIHPLLYYVLSPLLSPRSFPRAFVYYMLNYDDLRLQRTRHRSRRIQEHMRANACMKLIDDRFHKRKRS